MKLNLIVFLGIAKGTGKISRKFLQKFLNYNFDNFDAHHCKEITRLESFLEEKTKIYKKIIVFPFYREAPDAHLRKISKGKFSTGIEIAKTAQNICKKYSNVVIFHRAEVGEIIGNKIKTNILLSENGIKCPKIIKDKSYQGKIFVNKISDSSSKSKILKNASKISENFYNTEFIDTIFEYKNEKYYSAPRIMCVGKKIIEIQIRLKNINQRNPSVHALKATIDADLLNAYYENVILPNIVFIEKICENLKSVLGFGFYNHDFLISTKTKEIYVSETGYKFDNDTWKDKTENVVNFLKSETNREDTQLKILKTFEKEIDKELV